MDVLVPVGTRQQCKGGRRAVSTRWADSLKDGARAASIGSSPAARQGSILRTHVYGLNRTPIANVGL
jgi:hypothetical protein